ncbi:MAG: thiol oxidoreductase, partial [Chloroflexia bacterium]|nr:thiol oxidoreductase [Chloroflexia bacterium]
NVLEDDPEIDMQTLDDVAFYVKTLGVPAARNFNDPKVIEGRKIFEKLSCTACHTPSFTTGTMSDIPEISNQKIFPYTDMLLHDMGEDLADNRPEFKADGKEWKTRPLWGIGLTHLANGHTTFLHDGRARNLTEAILWHGGEAKNSREEFMKLSKSQRDNLLAF